LFKLQNQLESGSQKCAMGILVMHDVRNTAAGEKLNLTKRDLTSALREKYAQIERKALKSLHPLDVYVAYYKKFGYTYHVQLQLESVIHGKDMPDTSPLVDVMFIAEMKNMLLTAVHDLDKTAMPMVLKAAAGETYTVLNGKNVVTVPGDFMVADAQGVISSILRGPDLRTSVEASTKNVLFTVYAPPGIEDELIQQHLNDMELYVKSFSEGSTTFRKEVV
jgi:DNA/RNA-binding domain of Phe-tRNA-synthetase-like protein